MCHIFFFGCSDSCVDRNVLEPLGKAVIRWDSLFYTPNFTERDHKETRKNKTSKHFNHFSKGTCHFWLQWLNHRLHFETWIKGFGVRMIVNALLHQTVWDTGWNLMFKTLSRNVLERLRKTIIRWETLLYTVQDKKTSKHFSHIVKGACHRWFQWLNRLDFILKHGWVWTVCSSSRLLKTKIPTLDCEVRRELPFKSVNTNHRVFVWRCVHSSVRDNLGLEKPQWPTSDFLLCQSIFGSDNKTDTRA